MRRFPIALALCSALALSGLEAQDSAAQKAPRPPEVEKGYELIHQGKIAEALSIFRKLQEADPEDKYAQKAIRPLTQALQLQKILEQEKHPKFAKAADWLHLFYTKNKVPSAILPLARRAWERFPGDPTWGTRLAQALTADKQVDEALKIYELLLQKQEDPAIHAQAAVILARQKEGDRARKHLEAIPADSSCPSTTYNKACAHALLGDIQQAGQALQRAFELTPPSGLAARKEHALGDPDLAALKGSPELAAATKAKSLVAEPTGSACDSCDEKGSCSKAKEKGGSGESCEDGKHGEEKPTPPKKK